MTPRNILAAVALTAITATGAAAQGGGPEVSVGLAAVSFISSEGESAFLIGINNQSVRLGFPMSPTTMLEPSVSLSHLSSDGTSATSLGLGAYYSIYFGGSTNDGLYVAPGAFMQYNSFDLGLLGDESSSQVAFAFELGSKSRISDAVALRLGANVMLALENDDNPSSTTVSGIIGLAVKLR